MRLIEVYHADLLNGVGLREVLFFSGCEWHCKGCFQPWTADPECPQSHVWGEEDYTELSKRLSNPFISGVTFSGGDPFSHWNEDGIYDLSKRLKQDFPEKTIWSYTGYTFEKILELPKKRRILDYLDVLCDGQFMEDLKSPKKPWVGSENQRVINVQRSLKENKIILI